MLEPVHGLQALKDTFYACYYLGFTCFGGPPVHFQIFHKKFVQQLKWIDEEIYQELFAVSQALPGPASTKLLYCINLVHGGFTSAILVIFLWSLPGAIGMYGLALGIGRIGETLPNPVYALLSGLNAATVGIIALAAVQLSEKAITDDLTRILVFMGGAAGMLYTALWYFPVLMVIGGTATLIWDRRWLQNGWRRIRGQKKDVEMDGESPILLNNLNGGLTPDAGVDQPQKAYLRHPTDIASDALANTTPAEALAAAPAPKPQSAAAQVPLVPLSWKTGLAVLAFFAISFIVIITLRARLSQPSRPFSLFSNLYLAGTIIFGGGPVVIPLLREYVVEEGWVVQRDFLLALAIIQAMPGPNFNLAVCLGALAVRGTSTNMAVGALIGYIAIFAPGYIICTGFQALWRQLRRKVWLKSVLRGVHASAVGLVFAAVLDSGRLACWMPSIGLVGL